MGKKSLIAMIFLFLIALPAFLSGIIQRAPILFVSEETFPFLRTSFEKKEPDQEYAPAKLLQMWQLTEAPSFEEMRHAADLEFINDTLFLLGRDTKSLYEIPAPYGKANLNAISKFPLHLKSPRLLSSDQQNILWVLSENGELHRLDPSRDYQPTEFRRLTLLIRPSAFIWLEQHILFAEGTRIHQYLPSGKSDLLFDISASRLPIPQKEITDLSLLHGSRYPQLIVTTSRAILLLNVVRCKGGELVLKLLRAYQANPASALAKKSPLFVAGSVRDHKMILWTLFADQTLRSFALSFPQDYELLITPQIAKKGLPLEVSWPAISNADLYAVGISQGETLLASTITTDQKMIIDESLTSVEGNRLQVWSVALTKRGETLARSLPIELMINPVTQSVEHLTNSFPSQACESP